MVDFRGIPSLSVQNRKKHLHRSEPYDGADRVSLENLPGEPAYQESGFAAAEEKANLRALTAQLEPEQRELVLLRFAQQQLREIAQDYRSAPAHSAVPPACRIENLENAIGKEDWR